MKKICLLLLLSINLFSQEYYFVDSLSDVQLERLDSVASEFKLDDNCKGSLEKTKTSIACPDAGSFYNFGAWLAMNDKPSDYIFDKLRRRNATYYSPDKYTLAPSYLTVVGDTNSPVHIEAYVSADCPHCKKVGIPLKEMVESVLKGQVSFSIKPIHHTIGDYALLAAKEQGMDWELFIAYGDMHQRIDEGTVVIAAEAAGLDVTRLKKDVEDNNEKYQKIITATYTEAKKNGMNFTPALYFNGYRYRSNKHPLWLLDYVEYLTRTGALQ